MNSKESGFGSMTTLPRHGPEYRYAEKMNPYRTAIIIGAGITGIGASYYLGANNISYLVLEGKSDLGGVWNTQRWHGARCDSDIIKYSFSFKPFLSKDFLQNSD